MYVVQECDMAIYFLEENDFKKRSKNYGKYSVNCFVDMHE